MSHLLWSVLIVNQGAASLIREKLAVLRAAEGGADAEILVADNASSSEDRDQCRRIVTSYGGRYIQSEESLGRASLNNQLYRKSSGSRILLLDPHLRIPLDLLTRLGDTLDLPGVGAAGPHFTWDAEKRVHLPLSRGNGLVRAYGRRWLRRWPSLLFRTLRSELAETIRQWEACEPFHVSLLNGSCVALQREAVERAGGLFDQRSFLRHCEDEDLFVRLGRAGYRLLCDPLAAVADLRKQRGNECGGLAQAAVPSLHQKEHPWLASLCEGLDRRIGPEPKNVIPRIDFGRLNAPPTFQWADVRRCWFLISPNPYFTPCAGVRVHGGTFPFPPRLWETMPARCYWSCAVDENADPLAGPWRWSKRPDNEEVYGHAKRRVAPKVSHYPPEWDISPMRDGEDERFLELFQKAFGHSMSPEHFRWKYRSNPFGTINYVSRSPGGALMANHSGFGLPLRRGEETFMGCQCGDSMSAPEFRHELSGRRGAFVLTAIAFFENAGGPDRFLFTYGFPSQRHCRLGEMFLGYHIAPPVEWLIRDLPGPAPSPFQRLRRLPYILQTTETVPPDHDAFWSRVRRDYAFTVDKRRDYLTWRYTECPDRDYRFLYLRSRLGRILAMACVGIHGGQGRLLEYFPGREDPYAARLLLTLVEEHCTAAGATHLVAWTPAWSSTFRRLQQRGYRQEPTEFHLVARLFHPQLNMDWCLANFEYSLGDCDMF